VATIPAIGAVAATAFCLRKAKDGKL